MAKIFLVEWSNGHHECLPSQLMFLRESGHKIELHISEEIANRANFSKLADSVVCYRYPPGFLSCLNLLYRCLKERPTWIIYNTMTTSTTRLSALLAASFTKIATSIHNTQRFSKSKSGKVVGLVIKKYFVLAEYLIENLPKNLNEKKFHSFHSIFSDNPPISIPATDRLQICIPGQVELKRRNYNFLIKLIKCLTNPNNVVFDCLGPAFHRHGCGRQLKSELVGFEDKFCLYDGFVEKAVFDKQLSTCDWVMPLVDPQVSNFTNYQRFMITAAFNMALTYKKPLLVHESLKTLKEYTPFSVYYRDETDLAELLSKPERLKELSYPIKSAYQNATRLSFQFQMKGYLRHLELLS